MILKFLKPFLILLILSSFFKLLGEDLSLKSQLKACTMSCKQINGSSYEVSWEVFPTESEMTYFIFQSENWQDLKPEKLPTTFLEFPESYLHLIASTQDSSIILEGDSFFRIIGLYQDQFLDLITLHKIKNENEPLYSKRGVAPPVSEEVLNKVTPYLIPSDHPVKQSLDEIFSDSHILSDIDHMKNAGFEILLYHRDKKIAITKHPKLKDYVIKVFLDSSTHSEWPSLIHRAYGARTIQKILDEHQFNHLLKVPQKWIYQRKNLPGVHEGVSPKNFILIAEDMNIASEKISKMAYQKVITPAYLNALFITIKEGGLSDSHINNIPFSFDQRIAFIDTEYTNTWPVHFEWLTKYFSPAMQKHWEKLIEKENPSR